jgi:hypothetical protein
MKAVMNAVKKPLARDEWVRMRQQSIAKSLHCVLVGLLVFSPRADMFAQFTSHTALAGIDHRERIRVAANADTFGGRIESLTADTLKLRTDLTTSFAIPIQDVRKIWVKRGSLVGPTVIGAIVGAISLGLAGVVGARALCVDECTGLDPSVVGVAGGVVGGVVGAVGGLLIGSARQKWVQVFP